MPFLGGTIGKGVPGECYDFEASEIWIAFMRCWQESNSLELGVMGTAC